MMLDYIIYGVVDNGIMILGAMTGYELERFLPKKYQKVAYHNLNLLDKVLERINDGLDLLKTNPDVRLAFCFMNQVMYQQSKWKNKQKPLFWYLFQIVFIIQIHANFIFLFLFSKRRFCYCISVFNLSYKISYR
mgnify:CR=1 FL=1